MSVAAWPRPRRRRQGELQWTEVVPALCNWLVWGVVTLLVGSQFLGLVRNSTSTKQFVAFGRSPLLGLGEIPGSNDEPYSDRSIVCLAKGRSYVPVVLRTALEDPKLSHVIDTTGSAIHGYRVCQRPNPVPLDAGAYAAFVHLCERIDYTLDAIQDACDALGFNVTRDVLRVVDDAGSSTTRALPRVLPVLVLPFWDSSVYAHFAIPGWDGQACVFRLDGTYTDASEPRAILRATPRAVREAKTEEWLRQPRASGVWRHGWYEARDGTRWHSDMVTTDSKNPYGIVSRHFDMLDKGTELNCSVATGAKNVPRECSALPTREHWGTQSTSTVDVPASTALYVSNGSHFGLYHFEGAQTRTIVNTYVLEVFISNVSSLVLLLRWLVCMTAMLNGYRRGVAPWQTTGIGCLAGSRTFLVLPVVLLPRLKMALAAFWCVGGSFQGQQRALADAWFAVYPAIVEVALFYFSILNTLAKVSHRRMSDVLFGPTILVFAVSHYSRDAIASSGWTGFNGRIPTAVMSTEFERLTLFDLVTPSIALRMNGNVAGFLYIKLAVLAVNLIPLLLSEHTGDKLKSHVSTNFETTLAVRASWIGGLGLSRVYTRSPSASDEELKSDKCWVSRRIPCSSLDESTRHAVVPFKTKPLSDRLGSKHKSQRHELIAYEIGRLGYLVLGGKYLVTFDDWCKLAWTAPLRCVKIGLANWRVRVYDVTHGEDGHGHTISAQSRLCRLDDPELRAVAVADIALSGFQ